MDKPEIDHQRRVVYLPEGWHVEPLPERGRPINRAEEALEPEWSIVREWIERERPRSTDSLVVYRGAFVPRGHDPDDYENGMAARIANCLRRLGYVASGRSYGKTLYVLGDE